MTKNLLKRSRRKSLLMCWSGALVSLILICACDKTTMGDRERALYIEVLNARKDTREADFERCKQLAEPGYRGDCMLTVALRLGVRQDNPSMFCDRISSGTWRDECWFQAAEHRHKQVRVNEAVSLCQSAGRFRSRCEYHLWDADVGRAMREAGDIPGGDLVRIVEPVEVIWSKRLGAEWTPGDLDFADIEEDSTFEAVFWTRVMQRWHHHRELLDLTVCQTVPDEHVLICRTVLKDVLFRRVLDWKRRHGGECPERVADASIGPIPTIQHAPSEELVLVVQNACSAIPSKTPSSHD